MNIELVWGMKISKDFREKILKSLKLTVKYISSQIHLQVYDSTCMSHSHLITAKFRLWIKWTFKKHARKLFDYLNEAFPNMNKGV